MSVTRLAPASLVALAMFAVSVPVGDLDLGWHMKIGEHVLQHRELPRHALYTSLAQDPPFRANDWLGGVFYALAYGSAAFTGVAILRVVAVGLLSALLVFTLLRARLGILETTALFTLILAASTFRLTSERPYLFGYVCLAASAHLVFGRPRVGPRAIAASFAIQLAWTQIHGNAQLGPILAGCHLAGVIAARLRPGTFIAPESGVAPPVLLFVLAVAGYSSGILGPSILLSYFSPDQPVWEMMLLQREVTPEWRPTIRVLSEGALLFAGIPAAVFVAIFAAGTVYGRRAIHLAQLLFFLALLALGLGAIRFLPELMIGGAIPVATALAKLPRPKIAAALALAAGACAWSASILSDDLPRPMFRERMAWYPRAAARVLADGPPGKVCNTFEFGGYLHHALAPRVRPYVDGRMISAYPMTHLAAWEQAKTSSAALDAFTRAHDLAACVIAYPDPALASRFSKARWALVQLDDTSATFVRRDKADPAWLDRRELTAIDPINPFASSALAAVERDLDRAEALTDDRFLLTVMRARRAHAAGRPEFADLRRQAIALFPGRESLRLSNVDPVQFLDLK